MLQLLAAVGEARQYQHLTAAANVAVPVLPAELVTEAGGRPLWDRRIVHAAGKLTELGLLTRDPWALTAEGLRVVEGAATAEDFWASRRTQRGFALDSAPRAEGVPLNQILYGPPGTGKTYSVITHALACMGEVYGSRAEARQAFDQRVAAKHIKFVTFHQAFSYEDFVEGIRPVISKSTDQGGPIRYAVQDGIFKQMASDAAGDLGQAYVLVIDEINRGNVSGIFGELITLIEEDKREGSDEQLSVVLPYSNESFSIPPNLFILGTMNTADRSLAGLDLALRRRFHFKEMPPVPERLTDIQVPDVPVHTLLTSLNKRLQSLKGRDFTIGHAFFLPLAEDPTVARLRQIFEGKIVPLLQEYFFEDEQQIADALGQTTHVRSEANLLVKEDYPTRGHGRATWRYQSSVLDQPYFYSQLIGARSGGTPPPGSDLTVNGGRSDPQGESAA